jgi:PAS domain S-box-containing protein
MGLLTLLFVIIALLFVAGGFLYFRSEQKAVREAKLKELRAISELKVSQIASWRRERANDARLNTGGPFLRAAIEDWVATPTDAELTSGIVTRLALARDTLGYNNVFLAGVDGELLLSAVPGVTSFGAETTAAIGRAVAGGGVVFSDLFRCPACERIHLDVVAKVAEENGGAVAAMVLRCNLEETLYPLVRQWPTPSRIAESILVTKSGTDVLFLNDVRHQPNTALTLRIPLSNSDLPAARAVRGDKGTVEGLDYRGVPVVADVRPVPDSPWALVAKIDADELYEEATNRAWLIGACTVILIFLAAVGVAYAYKHQGKAVFRALYHAERTRREALGEIRAAFYCIGDGVVSTDSTGKVVRMNRVAEDLTGWSEAEALGKPLKEIFLIVNEDTRLEVESPVAKVIRERIVVGLANHTLLIARDGTERPIADSGAPVFGETGQVAGVVLVFRDQTEERQKLNALRDSERHFRTLFEQAAIGVARIETPTGRFLQVNRRYCSITGYSAAEMESMDFMAITHPDDLQGDLDNMERLKSGETREFTIEKRFLRKDGKTVWVELTVSPLWEPGGSPDYHIAVVEDITPRKQAETRLKEQLEELRRWHEATLGRENRVLELKREVNRLLAQAGKPARYPGAAPDAGKEGARG